MQTILITGGAGFIGSNLVDTLLRLGNKVICYDNFDNFYDRTIKENNIKEALKNPSFILQEADIRSMECLQDCFNEQRPDIVIHLAAKAGVRHSLENPELYYDVNVLGTLNILEAMKKFGIKKMIFASSSSVYGNNKKIPFAEDDPVDTPISPYAATKKASELLCHTYNYLYNIDIFVLRFFTVFGPRQRPDLAIHKFTNLIKEGKPIPFYGDGYESRDYTYIDDIIQGIVKSLEKLKGYEIINLGNSKTIKLFEMVKCIENALQRKAIIEKYPKQPGDVLTTFADISKAKNLIDYSPLTAFNEGVINFIKWKTKNDECPVCK